ncbi:MAG: methyltransferase domain-containing protein [Chloroflexi bacterium]|nr:methyltransferase domain-containing protein [Chloroflexota bacterium]
MKSIKFLLRRVLIQSSDTPAARNKAAAQVDLAAYESLYGAEAVQKRQFYNVGAGPQFNHPAWTKIDHPSEWYDNAEKLDLAWDLLSLTPLPVADGTACIVYTSYALEHVTDEAAQHFLNEACRALRPGGVLRVIVPDMDIYYRAWQAGDRTLFWRKDAHEKTYPNKTFRTNPNDASIGQNFLYQFASNASEIHTDPVANPISDGELNDLFGRLPFAAAMDACRARASLEKQRQYPGNHINWYNAEKLVGMFRRAGFASAARSGYVQSAAPILRDPRFFDFRRPEIGLYVEGVKDG